MAQLAVVAVQAFSALYAGTQKYKQGMQQADALDDAANRSMAATTVELSQDKKLKEEMESKALSVAANSGTGLNDPSVVKAIADINTEGEFRYLGDLYVGSSQAEGIRFQSDQARKEGNNALKGAYAKAITTAASAYAGGKLDNLPWTSTSNVDEWTKRMKSSAAAAGAKGSGSTDVKYVGNPRT